MGGMTLCAPGQQEPCYSGPIGSENVGACMAGTHQCLADGMSFGPCIGEVTPQAETCNTPLDDDCDGMTNEGGLGCVCTPNVTAGCYEGPPNTENVGPCKGGMHTCNDQGTAWGVCSGQVTPQTDFCMTPIDDDCSGSAQDCVGSSPWSKSFGAPSDSTGVGLAIDGAGNALLVAECAVSTDLGGGPLGGNKCLGKFNGSTGAHIWSKGVNAGFTGDIATDPAGNYIWAGGFKQFVDFGGGSHFVPDPMYWQSFLVKYAANGAFTWSKSIGNPSSDDFALDVATDGAGNVYVLGHFQGTLDAGAGMLTSLGAADFYIVKYSPAGVPLWSKSFGSAQAPEESGTIAVDGAGNVYLHVKLWFPINFGGGPLAGAGSGSFAMVKLDTQGNHVWSKSCAGGGSFGIPFAVTVDGAGSVIVGGHFETSLDCSGNTLPGNNIDSYVIKLDSSGNYVWGLAPALNGPTSVYGVAADTTNNVYVTGGLVNQAEFGGVLLTANGGMDVYMAKLSPAGAHLASQKYGDANGALGRAIALDQIGNVYLTGSYSGTIDFGSGVLMGGPGVSSSVFLTRLP